MPVPFYDLSELEEATGIEDSYTSKKSRVQVDMSFIDLPRTKQAKPLLSQTKSLMRPDAWATLSLSLTSWCSSHVMTVLNPKFRNASILQAWREKIACCLIIFFVSIVVTAFSMSLYCASLDVTHHTTPDLPYLIDKNLAIYGKLYDFKQTSRFLSKKAGVALTSDFHGSDLTALFKPISPTDTSSSSCLTAFTPLAQFSKRSDDSYPVCTLRSLHSNTTLVVPNCLPQSLVKDLNPIGPIYFSKESASAKNLTIYKNRVFKIPVSVLESSHIGKRDPSQTIISATAPLATDLFKTCGESMLETYVVGYLETTSWVHLVAEWIRDTSEMIMISIGAFKLFVSIIFHYWTSRKQVQGVEMRNNAVAGAAVVASKPQPHNSTIRKEKDLENNEDVVVGGGEGCMDPFVVMLVTCFSEDRASIRKTIESLSLTHYNNSKKLLFVVCDGLIVGSGNSESTPDAVLSLFSGVDGIIEEESQSYIAVADGEKRQNMASVHAGYYENSLGGKVPMVCVIKRGMPSEAGQMRSGNRGKRDSQLILFNFLASMNSRTPPQMSSLEVDLAIKIQRINGGINPSCYSQLLMVDADTAVQEDALSYMVQAMSNDPKIMGLCGETKVENAHESWISRTQVFDYYISHHFGKAQESVFGRVLCLPGCFSMYRVKDIPSSADYADEHLLIDNDVLLPYQEHEADTLHMKNLLHLGEDRYLTALMTMRFPDRRITFVPQAICYTTVPHTFSMLLSQRRRWINSSMHNSVKLLTATNRNELWVLVLKTYILLELISTTLLPITFCGILLSLLLGITDVLFELLVNTLLASLVILCVRLDFAMISDLLVYLSALPLWYFVFPLYGFWSQDNFSWGETRKVEGEDSEEQSPQQQQHSESSSGLGNFAMKALRKKRTYLFFFIIFVLAFQLGAFVAHTFNVHKHSSH